MYLYFICTAVQNERQPRNTATIRPEAFRDMEQGRALREAAVAVGVFGYSIFYIFIENNLIYFKKISCFDNYRPPMLMSPSRYGPGLLTPPGMSMFVKPTKKKLI